jgi:hypothetical protein
LGRIGLKGDAKGTVEMPNGDAKVVMIRWLWSSGEAKLM